MLSAELLLPLPLTPVHNEGATAATEVPLWETAGEAELLWTAVALLALKLLPRRWTTGCREKASSRALRRSVASTLAMLLAGIMAGVCKVLRT